MNVNITDNSTSYINAAGGGIYALNSNPNFKNVVISKNSSSYGGGLFCWGNSSLSLTNVMIFDNKAIEGWGLGGGIACKDSSYIYLKNVTIFGNSASGGGGILMANNSVVNFDNDNRCNIYLNYAGFGSDIYSYQMINVIVDTFTVINPSGFHANPIENFTFDILHGIQIEVDSDLYVSPEGDDSNNGLSWNDPLKTIAFAMSIIQADSLNPHTIHLSSGTYNQNTNGEKFPVSCISYLSLKGCGENETILDANIENTVLYFTHSYDAVIKGITITNGYSYFKGGGIYCCDSNPSLENLTINGNSTNRDGAGIDCIHSNPNLINVTISSNFTIGSFSDGGGIYCYYSSPSLANVTISNNTAVYGGGICCFGITSPSLVNTILWNNSPNEIYLDHHWQNSITIAYSDVQGGLDSIVTNNGTVNWLECNIDADPLFADTLNGDYHLQEGSPCIDAGTAYFVWQADTLVNIPDSAYYGTAPDMGAYEWQGYAVYEWEKPINKTVLFQNYPNPFSPKTIISYSLFKTSNVKIMIYNIKGQLVKTLVDDQKPAGYHTVEWNAKDISSGIYFYKLSTKDKTFIKKMILLN